ncbi:hypothetical protein [Streptomyces sp. NPDC056628]|uniref:hypothetical protein n=1 Tax=Streptomyces sp. NPDC056628 TaxID=3345882 RepID=UPI00368B7138
MPSDSSKGDPVSALAAAPVIGDTEGGADLADVVERAAARAVGAGRSGAADGHDEGRRHERDAEAVALFASP